MGVFPLTFLLTFCCNSSLLVFVSTKEWSYTLRIVSQPLKVLKKKTTGNFTVFLINVPDDKSLNVNCAFLCSSVPSTVFFFLFPLGVILTYFCSNELMFFSQMTSLEGLKINTLKQKGTWEELDIEWQNVLQVIKSQMPVPHFYLKRKHSAST